MPEEGGDVVPLIVLPSGTIANADGELERDFVFRFCYAHALFEFLCFIF